VHRPREYLLSLEDPRGGAFSFGASLALGLVTAFFTFGALAVTSVSYAKIEPLFAYLFAGCPTSLTIEHDAVRVRFLFGRDRCIQLASLHVQWLPYELVLHDGRDSVTIDAFLFPGESLDECAAALRPLAKDFVARSVQR
jgi:hypothetical protein